jgi:hypothetical protein
MDYDNLARLEFRTCLYNADNGATTQLAVAPDAGRSTAPPKAQEKKEMTLILTLGNLDQVIQISDRRTSWDARPVDNESNKAGVLTCVNAVHAFGFTGLAKWNYGRASFDTWQWLLNALYDSGPPDYSVREILGRLRDRASETFSRHPVLRTAPRCHKRLSIMFSGYLYHHTPPRLGCAILTNYQDFQTGRDSFEPWDDFTETFWTERRPLDHEPTFIQRVGNWHAMTVDDEVALRVLLQARKPAQAIIGKAVDLVREMADRPAARDTIGKQLSAISVPRNRGESVKSGYFSETLGFVLYMADWVIALGDTHRTVMRDYQARLASPVESLPIVIPKVGRNQSCPCGKSVKYKYCHGRVHLINRNP